MRPRWPATFAANTHHRTMDTLFRTLLTLHIAAGFIALFSGLLAIVVSKGSRLHARCGTLFHHAMVAVALTAVALSALKGGRFLLHIGLFALYQVHAGRRSIRNKGLRPAAQDWAGLALGGGNGVLMLATGNVVLLVFGGISTALALTDLRLFVRALRGQALPPLAWLRRHIGMMLGTYIATTTAFLLTLMRHQDVGWPHFLAPTIIGVPFIAYATWRFTVRRSKAAVSVALEERP
jgi:hypothetical protein